MSGATSSGKDRLDVELPYAFPFDTLPSACLIPGGGRQPYRLAGQPGPDREDGSC